MNFPDLFLIIYLSVTIVILIICFIEIGIFDKQTMLFFEALWFIAFCSSCAIFSSSRPYKLHELKCWEKRIVQIEQKIKSADNDIDKRYLIEGSLERAHIIYDYYYYGLFNEDPYGTITRAKNIGEYIWEQ
jgi:hypothetical protein